MLTGSCYYYTNFLFLGNFKELCKLYAEHNPEFSFIYNQTTNYCSWSIQSEILNIKASVVKEIIVKNVKDCGMFAIMCDEARFVVTNFTVLN